MLVGHLVKLGRGRCHRDRTGRGRREQRTSGPIHGIQTCYMNIAVLNFCVCKRFRVVYLLQAGRRAQTISRCFAYRHSSVSNPDDPEIT